MRKINKRILIIIMILAFVSIFTNNGVYATAGITSQIQKSLDQSIQDADDKIYEEVDKKLEEFNNTTDNDKQGKIKDEIKAKLKNIQNKNTDKYDEYKNKMSECVGIWNAGRKNGTQSSGTFNKQDGAVSTGSGEDPIANPDFYSPTVNTGTNASKLKDMANDVIGALKALGTILAVVILIFMGYKYMIGSASDRADFKSSMIPYLTGAILLFTIPTLLGILYDLMKNITL